MPETYGLLQLPIPRPSAAETPADPFLDTFLSFAKAVINAEGGDAWAGVGQMSAELPVEDVVVGDPRLVGITNSRLPALYAERTKVGASAWIAHDYYVRPSEVTLWWVPPRAGTQGDRARFRAFGANAIMTALDAVVDPSARHASWVVPEDTDPVARTRGTLIWRYLGVWELEAMGSAWVRLKLDADMAGMAPFTPDMTFDAIACTFLVRERNKGAVAESYDVLDGQSGTTQNDALDLTAWVFTTAPLTTELGAELTTEAGDVLDVETDITPP